MPETPPISSASYSRAQIIKPGDVIIDEIELESYTGFKTSLKGIFENFTIYEDIYSNCMSGSITLIDSMNLVRHFPIIGAETLTISYYTPFGSLDMVRLKFRTYKISVYVETSQQATTMVRIEFISPHAIKSMQTKVSKSYQNMPVSKMAEQIYMEYLALDKDKKIFRSAGRGALYGTAIGAAIPLAGSVTGAIIGGIAGAVSASLSNEKIPMKTIQETYDLRSYVIPYWNPLYTINWLAHRARASSNTTYCDYVFFENSDGHHFVPLSSLKTQQPSHKFTNYPAGQRSENEERMIEHELRNVMSMTIEDITDKVKQQNLATFASTILTHDMTTKSFNVFKYNYDERFEDVGRHMEKNRLLPPNKTDYSSASLSSLKYYPSTTYTASGLERIADPEDTVLYRQSLLTQMDSVNLILECHGDTNVKVGQVIEFVTFGKESTKKSDKFEDDYLKGKYLVTAIRHIVNDRRHRMTLTISKDSFREPVADFKKPTLV